VTLSLGWLSSSRGCHQVHFNFSGTGNGLQDSLALAVALGSKDNQIEATACSEWKCDILKGSWCNCRQHTTLLFGSGPIFGIERMLFRATCRRLCIRLTWTHPTLLKIDSRPSGTTTIRRLRVAMASGLLSEPLPTYPSLHGPSQSLLTFLPSHPTPPWRRLYTL
jgi:hypothetical protein